MSYYIQKGYTPEYLLSLGLAERLFFVASMRRTIEEEQEKIKMLLKRR